MGMLLHRKKEALKAQEQAAAPAPKQEQAKPKAKKGEKR